MALDLETGKLRWRTGSFHDARQVAGQPSAQMLDPARFAVLARGKRLWTVTRDLKDQNYNAKDMLMSVKSFFEGDVYCIVGVTEPLLEMKIEFVQAVNLDLSELNTLEFLFGYHVIQDDDAAEKVCYTSLL